MFDFVLSPSTSMASLPTRPGFDFRRRENFTGPNPPFDGVQPGAATPPIMGLGGGIGFVPAEGGWFKRVAAGISERSSLTCDVRIDEVSPSRV